MCVCGGGGGGAKGWGKAARGGGGIFLFADSVIDMTGHCFYCQCLHNKGNDLFWSKKLPQEKPENPAKPERATRQNTKAVKKTAHRKRTTASSNPAPDDDMDNPDLEVGLDSLGLFFMRLIDDDICQDDAEASHADVAEVIILSSDSDPLPLPKFCQANRKVKFSHPLAYLDPKFLMKTQQHEARRTTRHSGQQITSSGLADTPSRKRRPEVICSPEKQYPLKVSSDALSIRPTRITRLLLARLAVRRPPNCLLSK